MSKQLEEYSALESQGSIHSAIIRCPYSKCNSRIIKPSNEELETISIESIKFLKPSESTTDDKNNEFLKINDAWDFDNIGVSREFKVDETNENEKFIERLLVCADCERGPLGFARFNKEEEDKDVKNLRYYLHLNSVVFEVISQ